MIELRRDIEVSPSPIVALVKPPSVYAHCQAISELLIKYFAEHDPAITADSFRTQFIEPLRNAGPDAVIAFLAEIRKSEDEPDPRDRRFAAMFMSIGFCVLAAWADETEQRDLSILMVFEAKYWCGATMAARGISSAYANTEKNLDHAQASRAGKSKHKKAKAEVQRLAIEEFGMRPPGELNALEAARQLLGRVLDFVKKNEIQVLVSKEPDKVIARWLEKDSVTSRLFSPRRPGRPPKQKS
jgi:hypothetical protein